MPKTRRRQLDWGLLPPEFAADPAIPPLRIVLLMGWGDLVEEDVLEALRALGHQMMVVRYRRSRGSLTFEGADENLGVLADRVMKFGPHLILCCNVEGIGLSGLFPALAEAEGIPLIAWLVDRPPRSLPQAIPPGLTFAFLASYDRAHAAELRAGGYAQVAHLPLGVGQMCSAPWSREPRDEFAVGYAGNLFSRLVADLRADLDGQMALLGPAGREAVELVIERGIARFSDPAAPSGPLPWVWADAALNDALGRVAAASDALRGLVAPVIVHAAAGRQRRAVVQAIDRGDVHVWGAGWEDTVDAARCHAPVPYAEVGTVYRRCRVNLSISHVQNSDSATQRLFDVPAVGGFVLSDWRPSMADLFEEGEELIVFRTLDEARDLAERFAADHAARRRVSERAHARVLREHTYAHRLEWLTGEALRRWPHTAERPRTRRSVVMVSPPETAAALLGTLACALTDSAARRSAARVMDALGDGPTAAAWREVARAREALAEGRAADALARYRRVLAPEGGLPEAPEGPAASDGVLFDAGRACARAEGHAAALPWFRRAAHIQPRHPVYWAAVAAAYLEMADYGHAQAALERALALEPALETARNLAAAFSAELAGVAPRWEGL